MDHQAFAQLLGNYGEFVGAFAVVATLGYLAYQIKQNTKALHMASYQHDGEQMNRLNVAIMENADFAEVITKAFTDQAAMSAIDWMRFNTYLISLFHVYETLFQGVQAGTVPQKLWKAEENSLRQLIVQPAVADWWSQMLTFGPYTDEFRGHVEEVRSDAADPEAWQAFVRSPAAVVDD